MVMQLRSLVDTSVKDFYASLVSCIRLCMRTLTETVTESKMRNAPAMIVMMFGLEAETTQKTIKAHSQTSAMLRE